MKYVSMDLSRPKFREDMARTAVIVRGKCAPSACHATRVDVRRRREIGSTGYDCEICYFSSWIMICGEEYR